MLSKTAVLEHINSEINGRIDRLQKSLNDLKIGLADNTKSTAGDKHETSRAMAHNEQERLAVQLDQAMHLKRIAGGINVNEKHTTVQYGSIVQTSRGNFFFSLALGKITVQDENLFCIAANSPIGQALLGKKQGEIVAFNGEIKIIEVY